MTLEGSDIAKPEQKQPVDGSQHMRAEVDVINHLVLTNPARLTIPEVYSSEVNNMLNDFEIRDPKDFMNGVHSLSDRAKSKSVPLNKEFLEKVKDDGQIGKQERGVATVMSKNFFTYTNAEADVPAHWWTRERDLVLTNKDIARMDRTADVIDISKKHPEMRNASELVEATQSILNRNGGRPVSESHLRDVVHSPNYTDKERAAASILLVNFPIIGSLDKGSTGIDQADIDALSKLGAPKPEQKNAGAKNEACPKDSVAGKAAAWGVVAGVLSLATGSEHAMRNTLVAAGSGAASAKIKNSLECKTNR